MAKSKRLGSYIKCSTAGESFKAFIPPPLPPNPPLDLSSLQQLLAKASRSIGQLDGLAGVMPDRELFLYYYVRKEAVLSSQIEGTQSSLSDLLLYESKEVPAVPLSDVAEVSSYVAAIEFGLARTKEGFPLSLRLIREMHAILLSKGRGSHQQPGEFRTTQNWIGGSRPGNAHFVPPPPERLMECLGDLENYLHIEDRPYASLIEAGLIHVQFETIHPFLDGNGRIGRLLIMFFLMLMGEVKQPWLHLSLFFKQHRNEYYERLNAARHEGDWEGWLDFFLQGVVETADQVLATSRLIMERLAEDQAKVATLGRAAKTAGLVHGLLSRKAVASVAGVGKELGVSAPTARLALQNLTKLGIVRDAKGNGKERAYIYTGVIAILDEGAEFD